MISSETSSLMTLNNRRFHYFLIFHFIILRLIRPPKLLLRDVAAMTRRSL